MKPVSICFGYALLLCYLFSACKKNENKLPVSDSNIAAAKNYFESLRQTNLPKNPRFSRSRAVEWSRAKDKAFEGFSAVIAPVHYERPFYMSSSFDAGRLYNSNEITWLCIYKDGQQQYHVEQVAFFPDSSFAQNGKFSGLITVDKWEGDALQKFIVESNNTILQWDGNHTANQQSGTASNGAQEDLVEIVETCYEVTGYNYSVDDPNGGVYWSEPAGCSYSIIDDGGGGSGYASIGSGSGGSGGGGASSISPANNFTVLNGNNPIGNIIAYDKCFTNIVGSGNTFTVTVCVGQPKPGTRDAWTVSNSGAAGSTSGANPVNAGHTFLIFSQNTGGSVITRNVGFYPTTNVSPTSPSSQGQLNDDEVHNYDISLTVNVTNSQFFNMLNYIAQGNNAGYMYNLNTNNCTTFALNTLSVGDITLPRTTGNWVNGSGNDPGDLGEDIRSLNLSSNMSRNTVDNAHPNTGNCN